MGKGGPRHFSKPFVEAGLLQEVLRKHEDVLVNFRGYEGLSRNSGVDPRGLVHALPFVEDLLRLEPQCEVRPQPLPSGLLTETPQLNSTAVTGTAWVNLRCERINVLLFHVRRLARSGVTSACTAVLSRAEFQRLEAVLQQVVGKEAEGVDGKDGKSHVPWRKGAEDTENNVKERSPGRGAVEETEAEERGGEKVCACR